MRLRNDSPLVLFLVVLLFTPGAASADMLKSDAGAAVSPAALTMYSTQGSWVEKDGNNGYKGKQVGGYFMREDVFNAATRVGTLYGFTHRDLNFNNSRNKEQQNISSFGGYVSYRIGDWVFSDTLMYILGLHNAQYYTNAGRIRADYSSNDFRNNFNISYVLKRANLTIVPVVGFIYDHIKVNAHKDSTDNRCGEVSEDLYRITTGVRMKSENKIKSVRIEPFMNVNGEWGKHPDNADRQCTVVEIGTTIEVGQTADMKIFYAGSVSNGTRTHGGGLGFNFKKFNAVVEATYSGGLFGKNNMTNNTTANVAGIRAVINF